MLTPAADSLLLKIDPTLGPLHLYLGALGMVGFAQMNDFGRIVMCGQVGQYSGEGAQPGPNLMGVILKRLTVQGFLAMDYIDQHAAFLAEASRWVQEGKLKHEATVTQGLTNIHAAINSLVSGANVGK